MDNIRIFTLDIVLGSNFLENRFNRNNNSNRLGFCLIRIDTDVLDYSDRTIDGFELYQAVRNQKKEKRSRKRKCLEVTHFL